MDEVDWGSARLWLGTAYLSVTVLAVWGWFKALASLPAAYAGSFTFLVPVVAVVIELVRARLPSPAEIVGIALVLAGIYIGTRTPATPEAAATHPDVPPEAVAAPAALRIPGAVPTKKTE